MTETNEQRVARILRKLEDARNRRILCYGSESHYFRLNAPIDESIIARFEATHSIQLPADYRCFLQLAGSGGAGPFFGINSLPQWDEFITESLDKIPEDFLASPCPLYPEMSTSIGMWKSRLKELDSPFRGIMTITSRAYRFAAGLIVTGESAGRIVYVNNVGYPPYFVRDRDFLSWYERWLDEVLENTVPSFDFWQDDDDPQPYGLPYKPRILPEDLDEPAREVVIPAPDIYREELVPCPVCRKLIRDNARECRDCGFQFDEHEPWFYAMNTPLASGLLKRLYQQALVIILSVFIIGLVGGCIYLLMEKGL